MSLSISVFNRCIRETLFGVEEREERYFYACVFDFVCFLSFLLLPVGINIVFAFIIMLVFGALDTFSVMLEILSSIVS